MGVLDKYLSAIYKDGARGEIKDGRTLYDCWGLSRSARVDLYGRQLLGSRGGEYQHDPEGFTERYREQIAEMVEIPKPVPGCVVAVLRRRLGICTHVGLVVHDINRTGQGLHVLEINPHQNARLIPLYRFREAYPLRELKFYDDQSLSEST